jgi:hypothetical protein
MMTYHPCHASRKRQSPSQCDVHDESNNRGIRIVLPSENRLDFSFAVRFQRKILSEGVARRRPW